MKPSLLLAAAALLAPAPGLGQERARKTSQEEAFEARSFSIPSTQYARSLYERARAHVGSRRWSEAIADFQQLIEEHRGDLLAGRKTDLRGRSSQQLVHPGAAEQARRGLLELPPEARKLYADRYGPLAEEALAAARRRLDRGGLVEVSRRWPITPAASRAWLALGDLELELGNLDAARGAWTRAAELGLDELAGAARKRLDWSRSLAASSDDAQAATRAPSESSPASAPDADRGWTPQGSADLRLPGPGEARGHPPGPDCHAWPAPVRIDEDGPFSNAPGPETYNLFPVVWGDSVLVSNTMRLWAIDAFSGEVRWRSAEHSGWNAVRAGEMRVKKRTIRGNREREEEEPLTMEDFWKGVDRASLLVAPATAAGIAVAALQIPYTQVGNTHFQRQIPITTIIPDRRLYAFDLATGRELWSHLPHLPPLLWDGESGSFPERMSVAGPPVIAGTRLLVPAYRFQGRIDYHVACYDLLSGALLWSTAVIGGQRPLNMFGRPQMEFAAPPLRVEGERVIALTQLGAIASLDLYTGEIQWETLYDQIPLPSADGIKAGERPRVWKNAPPVVAGSLVLATPEDCLDVLALDLETGALLWSFAAKELSETRIRYGLTLALIGASEDTLYFAGNRVQSLQGLGGFHSGNGPFRQRISTSLMGGEYGTAAPVPRPALTERHVLVPTPDGRVALDRLDLARHDPQFTGGWGEGRSNGGNAVLSRGALYVLSNQSLTAFFDWQTVEERLARESGKSPRDPLLAARYGGFLKERAEAELQLARPRNALGYCARARAVLEPLLEGSAAIAERLHQVLRLEARILLDDASSDLALERLAAARRLAPDPERLRDTLLEMIALQATRDRAQWLELLGELERECGLLSMPEDSAAAGFPEDSDPPAERAPLSVGLWVLFQRLGEHARNSLVELELEDLHQILERFGDVPLPARESEELDETAGRRIARRLEQGHRGAYASFERRAQALLDQALAGQDLAALERIPALFPHSEAARAARDARLAAAYAELDVATVAQVVLSELPAQWTPASSTPRETQLALMLARTLQARGNQDFGAHLLDALAREHPELASELPRDEGRTLAELARELPLSAAAEWVPESSTFAPPASSAEPMRGSTYLVGSFLAPAGGEAGPAPGGERPPERVLVYVSPDKLFALSAGDPARRRWWAALEGHTSTRPSGWRDTALVASGRVLLAEDREVRAIDAASGESAWSLRFEDEILTVKADAGVAVCSLATLDGRPTRLVGLDLATGTQLWSQPLSAELWPTPVCGEGRLVLLPKPSSGHRGLVRELATGTGSAAIEFELGISGEDRRGAWIENDLLIVPRFARSGLGMQDAVVAYDLATGRRAWRVEADEHRELDSIVRCPDAYLILNGTSTPERAQSGVILQLDTRLGAVRQVQGVQLFPGDLPIGVAPNTVTELPAPYLFLRTPAPSGREMLVRAIHLPFGQRWVHRLPLAEQDILSQLMPLPALSDSTVALVYTEESRTRPGRPETLTQLVFLDKASGLPRGSQVLEPALGPAQSVQLQMLGEALLVAGRDQLTILQRDPPRR